MGAAQCFIKVGCIDNLDLLNDPTFGPKDTYILSYCRLIVAVPYLLLGRAQCSPMYLSRAG